MNFMAQHLSTSEQAVSPKTKVAYSNRLTMYDFRWFRIKYPGKCFATIVYPEIKEQLKN